MSGVQQTAHRSLAQVLMLYRLLSITTTTQLQINLHPEGAPQEQKRSCFQAWGGSTHGQAGPSHAALPQLHLRESLHRRGSTCRSCACPLLPTAVHQRVGDPCMLPLGMAGPFNMRSLSESQG